MSDCARGYSELRDQIVDTAESHLSREGLKQFISTFQCVINSKRRSSYINNFNDLITVLENRGCIGEADVGPFKQIVMLLPNCDILKERIYDYQCCRDRNRLRRPYVNHESPAPPLYSQNNSADPRRSRNSDAISSTVLPKAALDCVCKSIGTNWKDLARILSVREGDIDEIEEEYPRKVQERAYECMRRFIEDTDPSKVQQKLLYALDKCGRRDLREEVEEILNRRA